MSIKVTPVGYALGAKITGVNLRDPITEEEFQEIYQAWVDHLVLVFPGQELGPKELAAFTRRFGELDTYDTQPFNRHPEHNDVMVLTNRRAGKKPSPTYNSGQNWHTDLSYTVRPAKATAVYCIEKPSVGGDTMMANMYAAYEALSPKLREVLEGLEAVHDASLIEGLSRRAPEVAEEFRRLNPPVIHPAVREHPDSKRKALYINERVRQFVGMSEAESRPLIKYLCDFSVSPRFVYRHYWAVGDLVIWDNRATVHLAVGDYDPAAIRHMIRSSSRGDYVGRLAEPDGDSQRAPSPISSKEMAAGLASLAD